MGLIDRVKQFFVGRMLKKAATQMAIAAGSYAAANSGLTQSYGVSISVDPDLLALGLIGAANSLRNLLKVKMPKVFGWL